jgi:hypothetical protein
MIVAGGRSIGYSSGVKNRFEGTGRKRCLCLEHIIITLYVMEHPVYYYVLLNIPRWLL